MNKQFVMLSGLPRSGSTVLSSMLNQHPEIYATPTSPVADLLTIINDNWSLLSQVIVDQDPRQYANMITGLIDGSYQHLDQSVIIDKNRLWPRFGKLMNYTLGEKPKIICTVRNISDILASYILLLNKNLDHGFVDQDLVTMNLPINMKNRCKILWEKYIIQPYTSFRIGYNSTDISIHLVEYTDIINNPQQVLDGIFEFIGIDSVDVNTFELKPVKENDAYHGGLNGLHDVRPILTKTSPLPEQVIGNEIVKHYNSLKLEFWHKTI